MGTHRMEQLILEEWEVVEKEKEGRGDIQRKFHWRRDFELNLKN